MASAAEQSDTSLSPKKRKIEAENGGDSDAVSSTEQQAFSGFKVERILNEISQRKTIFVQGKFAGKEGDAVVILEKTPFSEKAVSSILTGESQTTTDLQNDIYNTLELFPPPKLNGIKTTLIYPATERHISKYTSQEMFLVEETADIYKNITLPHIQEQNFSIQWVHNILEKKTESERIVFEDPDPVTGFILLPDMKWDRKQTEDLYLVGIVHQKNITSLRDLTAEHIPLLKNIMEKGKAAIKQEFDVSGSKLRIYLHYQPSYYHLHVHFTHLQYEAPGSGCERGHLLSDVISNLSIAGDYYQKSTLTYTLKGSDALLKKFQDAGNF